MAESGHILISSIYCKHKIYNFTYLDLLENSSCAFAVAIQLHALCVLTQTFNVDLISFIQYSV